MKVGDGFLEKKKNYTLYNVQYSKGVFILSKRLSYPLCTAHMLFNASFRGSQVVISFTVYRQHRGLHLTK